MILTKAFVSWFDGFQGVAVDYLDNQIAFHVSQVSPDVLEYLEANTPVLLEDDGYSLFVTTPENSFDGWENQEREIYESNTVILDGEDNE